MKHSIFHRIIAVCAVALCACLAACANGKTSSSDEVTGQQSPARQNSTVLVAFFSATGTTKAVAERLATELNADIFEIEPQQPYTQADLDWRNKHSRSTIEMKDSSSRPAVKDKVTDMTRYQTIYVGFPVWWYTAPTIVRTFLEEYDLSGKTIIPFATSGGSDIANVHEQLKSSAPKSVWRHGRLLNGVTDNEIKSWVSEMQADM